MDDWNELALVTLIGVAIRLLMMMMTIQQRRERLNRQINQRLRTLIAYKTLGGSFTGKLTVDPSHLRDLLQHGGEPSQAAIVGVDLEVTVGSERGRRIRDAVEAALSDIILLGTDEQPKNEGGRKRTFFLRAMQNKSDQRHRLGVELRQALAREEFELWYQPQISLSDHTLSGVEALLRWRHSDHRLLAPDAFMAVLEESAIAEDVGDWIIEQACAVAAGWKRASMGSLQVGVNLFPVQLRSGRLFEVISSALVRHDLAADQFEVEITENTVLRHNNQSTKALKRLKALGVGVAFDDFGTGFASLSLSCQMRIAQTCEF